jgi:hypothetical protein
VRRKIMLWQTKSCVAGTALALLMFGAGTASAHSVYEAEQTLYQQGYSDIRVERASLPYSFIACKRGVRYHIHVDYYGDLVQVDPMGSCYGNGNGYGSEYENGARYDDRYRYRDYGGRVPYDSRYRYR